MKALIDTGATGQFIDIKYVWSNELQTYHLPCSLAVYNVDGTPNKAGRITEAVDLVTFATKTTQIDPPFTFGGVGGGLEFQSESQGSIVNSCS